MFPGIAEANVYGVLVPKHDGRAGMVSLVLKSDVKQIDFEALYALLASELPRYAVPVFIRLLPSMNSTGTFKQQKVGLRNEGIDLDKIPADQQPIYWLKGKTYVPFTQEDYARLARGESSL